MGNRHVFLTSFTGGMGYGPSGERVPAEISRKNGLLDNIKAVWPSDARVLMICASPDYHEKNDDVLSCFERSLPMSGLDISSIRMCDDRDEACAGSLDQTDVIILTGGHVPTQNAFFGKIGLKEKLEGFDGVIIAWSAGSMNCASNVYAGPELPGESIDPLYKRWIQGLGLTDVNIFPHFQSLRGEMLDGRRLIEDITFEDSMGHEFIALNDGSYIVIDEQGETVVYGESYSILDGKIEKICDDGGSVMLGRR